MRILAVVLALLTCASAQAADVRVYGPGGPAPAMTEAAAVFSKKHSVRIDVTAGPTSEWKTHALADADVIYSGSESMMSDFLGQFADVDPATVTPLYLRASAILVRPGNPKHIRGLTDLIRPGTRVVVVTGSGQGGLWEDVAGRLGNIDTVRALRSNIVMFAGDSAKAKAAWQAKPELDAWLIWNIWQVANPTLADVVEIEPEYRIYRDAGVALTSRGKARREAREFVRFLQSKEGAAIFAKWGWRAERCKQGVSNTRRPGASVPQNGDSLPSTE